MRQVGSTHRPSTIPASTGTCRAKGLVERGECRPDPLRRFEIGGMMKCQSATLSDSWGGCAACRSVRGSTVIPSARESTIEHCRRFTGDSSSRLNSIYSYSAPHPAPATLRLFAILKRGYRIYYPSDKHMPWSNRAMRCGIVAIRLNASTARYSKH